MNLSAKNKKMLIIAGIVVAVLAAWYFFFRKRTEISQPQPATPGTSNGSELNPSNPLKKLLPNASFPLQLGSYGQQVQHIQAALNLAFGESLAIDGRMGAKTLAAVEKHFKNTSGKITWIQYMAMYNRYGSQIQNYLKGA